MESKKPWPEMTEKEIAQIKWKQCCRCSYGSYSSSSIGNMTCDYIIITGHRRPCLPYECVEQGIFKPKAGKRRKKQIVLSGKPKAQVEKPAPGQQEAKERFESLVSTVTEKFNCTKDEALDYLRKRVREQGRKENDGDIKEDP